MSRRRHLALVVLAWVTLCVGCSGKSSTKTPPPKKPRVCGKDDVQRSQRWLQSLCKYKVRAMDSPTAHWWGLRLVTADSGRMPELPTGTLMVLTPRALIIDGEPAPDWPKPKWQPVDLRRGMAKILEAILARFPGGKNTGLGKEGDNVLGYLMARSVSVKEGTMPAKLQLGPRDIPSGRTLLAVVAAMLRLRSNAKFVSVAVEPETPAFHVSHLFHLLELAGYHALGILGAPGYKAIQPPPVPDPAVRGAMGTLKAGTDKTAVVKRWRRLLAKEEQRWIKAGCTAMSALRRKRRKATDDAICGLLSRELPAVMKACKCVVGSERLRTLWQAILTLDQPIAAWLGELDPGHTAPVTTPASTPWSKLGPKLMNNSSATKLWIRITPK